MATNTADLLQTVNWDFPCAAPTGGVHSIHAYPARFIPEIPHHLISLLHPGDRSPVLDPFCGSGTTLVEAIRLGIDAWGVDLSPLACLISEVKTSPCPPGLRAVAAHVLCAARARLRDGNVAVPAIPRLSHWFKPDIQHALAALVTEIQTQPSPPVRKALQVALSSIIVRVSNQESDTRYAAVDKSVSTDHVLDGFQRAVNAVAAGQSELSASLFSDLGHARVINADILELTPDQLPQDVGLVVTSPPYPNAYEYWLYHKYRMYWLGMDPIAVRQREIGARAHYFKKNHQDEHDFQRQMSACFALFRDVTLPNARICFLVGRSIIHGRVIDNVSLLRRGAAPHGYVCEAAVPRAIPSRSKSFNPQYAGISQEHVVIFRRKDSV